MSTRKTSQIHKHTRKNYFNIAIKQVKKVCKQKWYWSGFLAQIISFQSEIEAEIFQLSRVENICSKFNLIMLFN